MQSSLRVLLGAPGEVFVIGAELIADLAAGQEFNDAVGRCGQAARGRDLARKTLPGRRTRPLFSAWMDSMSRWFVGWSSRMQLAPESIIFESIHRTFRRRTGPAPA